MRIRVMLAGSALALLTVIGFAGNASAQEAPKFANSAAEECHTKLEEGKSIDDCQKAPSLILPATNEIVWGSISFIVLFFLLYKFAWPGLKKGMDGRVDRIRGDVSAAEQAKADAQAVLDDYRRQLADARNESGRIIEEARQTADALKKDQEQRLQAELAAVRERATADIEAAKTQAIADLRAEVASIAIGAAEVVVQHNLDHDTQVQLIESYINQVGTQR